MSEQINKLVGIGCVILGGMAGYFIGLPLDVSGTFPFPVTPLFIVGGLVVGWRRRHSRAFLYFAVACVLILSTLVSFSMLPRSG